MSDLTAGVGSSDVGDSREAGRNAARMAREEIGERYPSLVVVYASVEHQLSELLAGVREITGTVPLVGVHLQRALLRRPGGSSGWRGPGPGAVLGAVPVRDRGGHRDDGAQRGRGAELARTARSVARVEPGEHSALLVFADGLRGRCQQLLNGIYRVAGASVPVVGGAAGDDRKLEQTFVFHRDQVLADAAVAVWIVSPEPVTVVSDHGWNRSAAR